MGLVDREHLPECPQAKRYGMPCICPEIHACELRMMQRQYLLDEGDPYREAYRGGYAAGLDAAEAAVADMVIETVGNSAATVSQAVTVIAALKEKP